jgi:hypothetical protein
MRRDLCEVAAISHLTEHLPAQIGQARKIPGFAHRCGRCLGGDCGGGAARGNHGHLTVYQLGGQREQPTDFILRHIRVVHRAAVEN